ncbi:hypothetical protein AC579_7010 [Pseudocercospora musae]|uniref:Uncharacterized protein n=1 Tax=Pseudocercospora musae TaxID=113226 RepID=A0A139HD97_9PEZI|nr:hypothetical protein AC579_7010 [Pseudocercospora musae]
MRTGSMRVSGQSESSQEDEGNPRFAGRILGASRMCIKSQTLSAKSKTSANHSLPVQSQTPVPPAQRFYPASTINMHFIAIVSALFTASAFAAPQWGGRFPEGSQGFRDGNQEGPYHGRCSCTRDGVPDQWLGAQACRDLHSQYPNLNWDGHGCVDFNGRGVEANGFRRACQRQAGGYAVVDAKCGN